MKTPSAKNGSNNKGKEGASGLPMPLLSPTASELKNSQHQSPKAKRAMLPTENQLKVIRRYGEVILREIAYGIRDKCGCPFCPDGSLTQKGLEAARDIVDNLYYGIAVTSAFSTR